VGSRERFVAAGVCRQCGEQCFASEVVKNMDAVSHEILHHRKKPERLFEVPAISFFAMG
jgi:hypothetical protein